MPPPRAGLPNDTSPAKNPNPAPTATRAPKTSSARSGHMHQQGVSVLQPLLPAVQAAAFINTAGMESVVGRLRCCLRWPALACCSTLASLLLTVGCIIGSALGGGRAATSKGRRCHRALRRRSSSYVSAAGTLFLLPLRHALAACRRACI
jgi:hypothetical protein